MSDAGQTHVVGILLAAGHSSRMEGACKLALPIGGMPMLCHSLYVLRPYCDEVIVVLGAHEGHIRNLFMMPVHKFAERVITPASFMEAGEISDLFSVQPGGGAFSEVTLLPNPAYRDGMFSSIRAGVRKALSTSVPAEQFLLLPGDCCAVHPGVCCSLLASEAPVAVPVHQGRPGHPVRFNRCVAESLLSAAPDATLKECLAALHPLHVPVDDPGILMDVDTPADYERVRAYMENG